MNPSEQARRAAYLVGFARQQVDDSKIPDEIVEDEVLLRLRTVDNLLKILGNDLLQMAKEWKESLIDAGDNSNDPFNQPIICPGVMEHDYY